ncbi:MAG: phosphatidylglycerophosphatase A [Planctomycetota bacterium]
MGYLPVAPGTRGSAGAVLVALGIFRLFPRWVCIAGLVTTVAASTFIGVKLGVWAEQYFEKKDPGEFILDEMAGQWLTCVLLIAGRNAPLKAIMVAFIAFSFFDIVKSPPILKIEKLPAGWGMMMDDLVAALYATVAMWILSYFQPHLVVMF